MTAINPLLPVREVNMNDSLQVVVGHIGSIWQCRWPCLFFAWLSQAATKKNLQKSERRPRPRPQHPRQRLLPPPSGVFVHRDMAPSPNGHDVEFYSILRFGKDGQVCSVNVSAELDDEVLSRYSKSCDAREKGREYGKYTL